MKKTIWKYHYAGVFGMDFRHREVYDSITKKTYQDIQYLEFGIKEWISYLSLYNTEEEILRMIDDIREVDNFMAFVEEAYSEEFLDRIRKSIRNPRIISCNLTKKQYDDIASHRTSVVGRYKQAKKRYKQGNKSV